VLCCAVLCCAVLCCAVLCCAALCCGFVVVVLLGLHSFELVSPFLIFVFGRERVFCHGWTNQALSAVQGTLTSRRRAGEPILQCPAHPHDNRLLNYFLPRAA
jgi:hypothetical protein